METAPLKSYATWARTELIKEVGARIAAVLAPGSTERVEEATAVKALETAVKAAGGEAAGRAKVADKVAYTWFNRIIALRFMDANGYTGIGIVSPHRGQTSGQPEVLADAKRGIIDTEVIGKRTAETITALLDGTRLSTDPQGEVYSLLLADYCRYWHRSMPFMFEREGDYTELLIPANLLAEDSVLARSVTVLTEEVCQDVEVIGWLYQFYISERKDEVFAGFKKNKKAGADEIPAATQLFTPHWIVRYLVENSLGRLWMLNHPDSRLVDQMDYYIAPVDEETDFLRIDRPEQLKVIDPAVGSGHMLTYAFDLLYAIYEEEGYTPSEVPGLILQHNLYGIEIDPRAGALAAFALTMKAATKRKLFLKTLVQPNICVLENVIFDPADLDYLWSLTRGSGVARADADEFWKAFEHADTFGSLIQPKEDFIAPLKATVEAVSADGDLIHSATRAKASLVLAQAEYLSRRYSAVVANPPYMGTINMGERLRAFAEVQYRTTYGDLCTMMLERSLALIATGGYSAIIASESWIFTSSYEGMRGMILQRTIPLVVACIDKSAFGVVLNTVATVLHRSVAPNGMGRFFRVGATAIANGVSSLPVAGERIYDVDPSSFARVPGAPFAFDFPSELLKLYAGHSTVGARFQAKQGLATGENARFVRQWWEVSNERVGRGLASRDAAEATGRKWFPYNKGGTPRPWYGRHDLVVNWEHDGAEIRVFGTEAGGRPRSRAQSTDYYFLPAVTWSKTGSSGARFRLQPRGFIHDINGMSVFPSTEAARLNLLGYLNSALVRSGLDVLSPTMSYQIGDVARLPLVDGGDDVERVTELVRLEQVELALEEVSPEFQVNGLISRTMSGNLAEIVAMFITDAKSRVERAAKLEQESSDYWAGEIRREVGDERGAGGESAVYPRLTPSAADIAVDLLSYAVGCMFGRYSLEKQGLILADQGSTLQDYFAQVRSPSFMPDQDNVLPIVDGDWFEDDIVERFRQFLRVAFGEQHFEENLRFVTEALGVKSLRGYFVKSFYKDHVQRYKKRPIYWLFSSPRGSFNALIYMHRYTPSTVSTVLNEYLREFQAKLQASLTQAERSNNAREADRLRKVLVELNEYEHDVLYPLATQQLTIDLDDGVKANYPKFGAALKKIPGLEANDE